MRELVNKAKTWLGLKRPVRKLIYNNAKGETKLYLIDEPQPNDRFGNQKEQREEVGFRVYVHNKERNAIRSFRNDRVVAII